MSAPSWATLLRHGRAAHTLILTLGVGVHAIDVFIIATVLPSVVADIGGAAFYTWSTMLYVVASILGTACGGFVRARCDLRRAYTGGALVFLLGSLGCAVAPHMAWLLLARVAQGLGGGMLIALSYGMASELYPADLRPRVFSMISGVWGTAALLGPTVGGVFAAIGWWRGAFWVAAPVISGLIVLAWYTLPAAAGQGATARFPWDRLLLLGGGVLCVACSGQVAWLLLITCSIAGQAMVVVHGSLPWLGVFMALHGIGIGICFAHLSSWTISAARRGEEHLTASSMTTVRSLGQAFGATMAGLIANAAGLAQGVSVDTVASAATWVYGLGTLVPVVLTVLALRFLWLHRQIRSPSGLQHAPPPGTVASQE